MPINEKVRERLDRVKKHGWQVLDLRNCGLSTIPTEVFGYNHLRVIDLGNDSFCEEVNKNKIKSIPSEISFLTNLSKLDLSDNSISEIHEDIINLKSLQHLDLSKNKLKHLSEKVANLPGLKELNLDENPFDLLPPEIVARGVESIRNFIKELETKDYLYEVKLLIIGEGRVGKSCLTKALIDEKFKVLVQN
jgi:internalin A